MIELLMTLVASLCEPNMTVLRFAALIGEVQPRPGDLSPWEIEPRTPLLMQAEIIGDREDAAPDYARLTLSEPAGLSLASLRAAFGEEFPVPRSRPGQGDRWAFYVRPSSKPVQCAIIAETDAAGDERVRSLTLRRDTV